MRFPSAAHPLDGLQQFSVHPFMKSSSTVLLFAPPASPAGHAVRSHWPSQFGQIGLEAECITQASELYARLLQTQPSEAVMPVLLAGDPIQNAMVCAYIKNGWPAVPVACVADPACEAELAAVLDAGANLYLAPTAGQGLLMAVVRRMLALVNDNGSYLAGGAVAPDVSAGGWRLLESRSVLVAPSGERIKLTMVERRVLRVLFAAPAGGLSHDALLLALRQGHHAEDQNRHAFGRTRLTVMFSRLRRKCARQGLALPVASVHGWGYQFTGFDSLQ